MNYTTLQSKNKKLHTFYLNSYPIAALLTRAGDYLLYIVTGTTQTEKKSNR